MRSLLLVLPLIPFSPQLVCAQYANPHRAEAAGGPRVTQGEDGAERAAAQRGSEPNQGEVRPGSPDGNRSSRTAGTLVHEPVERRILGLPVTAAIVIAGVLLALIVLAGIVIPRSGRRAHAQGNRTHSRR